MFRLVQLSDLHFGRIQDGAIPAVLEAVHSIAPDLIVITGDLTQRAFRGQFREAAQFLRALPREPLCMPGNHDVPMHNPLMRLVWPLALYRRAIDSQVEAFHEDDMVAVAALNTAHGWTVMDGRLTWTQHEWVKARFAQSRAPIRIVASHHPLDLPREDPHPLPALARRMVPVWIERLGVDVFLAGHLHRSRTMLGPVRTVAGRTALFAQAGTSTSDRHSGAGNAFNLLLIEPNAIEVQHWTRAPDASAFSCAETGRFTRIHAGWCPDAGDS
jgi:3',5'-cyclic AMP phosphodiesterase CpdA